MSDLQHAIAAGLRWFAASCDTLFDRQTASALLVIGPAGKTVELTILGNITGATRFALVVPVGVFVAVRWHQIEARLQDAAEQAADTVEDA